MGNESAIHGHDQKGPDPETLLIGPITTAIIDADRLVRMDWSNGFPNWAMYRTALAGDSVQLPALRRWVVAFSVAYCTAGGVRRSVYSDELACVAAWDALHMLLVTRELQPYTTTAAKLKVHHKTYRRLRDALYLRMKSSLDAYWDRLCIAHRQVRLYDREQNH